MKKINKEKVIEYLSNLLFRCMSVIIIFLLMAIFSKKNSLYKDYIISNVYGNNLSFTKIQSLYKKYLGGIIPLEKINNDVKPVFKESLEYDNASLYYDGVKLSVIDNYLVPSLRDGMVTYIGEKENYGNVIIVTTEDDVNIWYGNMSKVAVKLYDYVSSGDYLGEIDKDYLYLIISKDNKYLDYKEFLNES